MSGVGEAGDSVAVAVGGSDVGVADGIGRGVQVGAGVDVGRSVAVGEGSGTSVAVGAIATGVAVGWG